MKFISKWITGETMSDSCPVFRKKWKIEGKIQKAGLYITSIGVYEALLNGRRVGKYVLAPGWTSYESRLQYQYYDITEMLLKENELQVTVGKGWALSPMPGFVNTPGKEKRMSQKRSLLAQLEFIYEDGTKEIFGTDDTWEWAESSIRFSEIYDGE